MDENILYVKNMVCRRCILVVGQIFEGQGITPRSVELGVVALPRPLSPEELSRIRQQLESYGFELIDDRHSRLLEQIRVGIIEYVHHADWQERQNLSDYLQDKCHAEYSSLSKLFSEMKGISIEKYYIAQRVELVKELLTYGELTVSEIAYKLHYSSVAHLSAQFKAQTGMSPTQFKHLQGRKRQPLDEV